ncbi:MAG: mersacidin/lichenicidin family type 2 lantibiotic [Fischerella sp. CENA71]|nr:mersacidin/lichenicidin family type 2 lantibiotic [Fischerella sp. CENA71]
MSQQDIIRAWKDEDFRNSLTEEQLSQLPENPAGILELEDEEMKDISGGRYVDSNITCDIYCWYWSYFTR